MADTTNTASYCAQVSTSAGKARPIMDALAEMLDPTETVVAISEERDGSWTVALHFRQAPDEAAVRALIRLTIDADTADALVFEAVAAADWVAASLQGLPPVTAGRFVVHGAHDRVRVPTNRIGIEIEAALAFGTGHHGTTRGCLIALDRIAKRRRFGGASRARILDLGTGSGVLAIAAARTWQRPVLATDNDPRAVRVARANARLNRAGRRVEVLRADGCKAGRLRADAPFDLIFANILLAPLKRMAAPMARLACPHGRVILSGLLAAQANEALAAYCAQGLHLECRIELEGWSTLVLRRGALHRRAPRRGVAARRPRP